MTTTKTLRQCLNSVVGAAALACAFAAAPAAAIPVLVGSATLNTANDLTVIQDGGQALAFLDFAATKGSSVADAVATYGGAGFRWATGTEVAQLYAAFGITYQSIADTFAILNVPLANAANFTSYLGTTFDDAALAWIDDNTSATRHTYACISETTCNANAFVENTASFWPSNPDLAIYLVRDQQLSVPEPMSALLVGYGLLGLLGLAAMRRSNLRRYGTRGHVWPKIEKPAATISKKLRS